MRNKIAIRRQQPEFDAITSLSYYGEVLAEGILTDEHATSSYGLPVIVIAGLPYGPADLAHTYGAYYVTIEDCPRSNPGSNEWPELEEIQRGLKAAGYEDCCWAVR